MQIRHLNQDEMLRAVGMLEAGTGQALVAEALHSSQSIISRLWARFQETGDVSERHAGPSRLTACSRSFYCANG